MDNSTRRLIESAFYNYQKNKTEAAEYISDLCSVSSPILDRIGSSAGISDPTAMSGIKLAEYRKYLWCEVVERTITTYRFEYEYTIIRRKYFDKWARWKILYECGVSKSAYYYWLRKIYATAEMWARELKLL